jgi:hypothetical protein
MKASRLVLGLLVAWGLAGAPREAGACINGVELEIERFNESPTGQIFLAERDLQNGHETWAAAKVRGVFPNVRSLDASAVPLALRAQRVYALAIVRTEGKLDAGEGWAPWGNAEWALETLRALEEKKPNNPAVEADLAEAQITLLRTRGEGVRVLEALDAKDLLGSAYAYRALARARKVAGDDGGVLAAVRRCAMMSTDRSRCTLSKS